MAAARALEPATEVAVAVVRRADGRVLLAERTARQVAAGFWELPGGKIDAGETAEQAAARELREEVGVRALQLQPWLVHTYEFPTKRVRLHLFRVQRWDGEPRGHEGQRVAWVDPAAPEVGPLLPSNARALMLLALPAVLYEAQVGHGDGGATLLKTWLALAARGARWLLLRAPALAPAQRTLLVWRLRESCRRAGLAEPRVVLAGSTLELVRAGCAGLLTDVSACGSLPARPPVEVWSMDCADADEALRAQTAGADMLLLKQVDPSVLQQAARRVVLPVYLRAAHADALALAQAGGAAGVVLDVAFARAALAAPPAREVA